MVNVFDISYFDALRDSNSARSKTKHRACTYKNLYTADNRNILFETDKDNTAIIVGVTVPIVLLLTLLGIGLLVRRRRSQGRKTTETRTTDNLSLPDSVIDTRQVG